MTSDEQPGGFTAGARDAENMSFGELGQKVDQETEWGSDTVDTRPSSALFELFGADVKVAISVANPGLLAQGEAHWRKLAELKALYGADDWAAVERQIIDAPLLADAAIKARPMITQVFGDAQVILRVEPDPFDGRVLWTWAMVRIPQTVDGHATMLALTKQWHTIANRRFASLLHIDTEYIQ